MAYDRRISELQESLKAAAPNPDDPARKAMAKCIADYAGMRSSALEDLVTIVNNAVVGTTGVQARWKERVDRVRADLDRQFGDSVKDVMLPAPLQAFWAAAVRFERSFFERLGSVKTSQLVEDLLKHQGVLAKTIVDLQTNWNDLLSADKSLEGEQLKQVQDLDRLVQALIDEVEAQYRKVVAEAIERFQERMKQAAEKAKSGVKNALGEKGGAAAEAALKIALAWLKEQLNIPSEAEPEIEAQKGRIQVYLEKLSYFSRVYRERAAQYRNLMSIEKGGILTMFKNTRAQVAEYLKNNNLVTAQIWRDEAKRHLQEWAAGGVGGQGDDAAEFNKKIFDLIDRNWKVTEEMDKQFQGKFSGIFTAPLTSDTLETLTESYMFRKAIDDVNARGASAKLDEAQKKLAGAVQETVDKAATPLEQMDTDWPAELKEAARLKNAEFRSYVQGKLKGQIDQALLYLGELRVLLDPPKVRAEFSREELEAFLR
jgi:hypothetical protein